MEEVIQMVESPTVAQEFYQPSELIHILSNWITRHRPAQTIRLRGIYQKEGSKCYGGVYYDILKDENREESLWIKVSEGHRNALQNGQVANISGVLNRNVTNDGHIKLTFEVTRVESIEERHIDKTEVRRMELRQLKSSKGFKNIDTLLESLLFKERPPKIALLLAEGSITLSDFDAGIKAAKSAIDFHEHRTPFSKSRELASKLQQLDSEGYDVLAIIRGGGSGIEALDDLEVLSTISKLKTPVIGAIGHVEEKLFIKQMLDKVVSTPTGLGHYFSDLVERVSEEMSRSRAVLTEKIRKQFESQLAASQKQNKELQERLSKLDQTQKKNTETMQQATKQLEGQLAASQRQNKELQDRLSKLDQTQKQHSEAMQEVSKQQLKQNTVLQEQLKHLGDSLKSSQEQNKRMQEKLDYANMQKEQLKREFATASEKSRENYWKPVAIVAVIICLFLGFALL